MGTLINWRLSYLVLQFFMLYVPVQKQQTNLQYARIIVRIKHKREFDVSVTVRLRYNDTNNQLDATITFY